MLTHIIMAVLGAALGIGLLLSFYSPSGGSSLPGSGAVPGPGTSAGPLSGGEQTIVGKVKPGLVIINATLQYDGEIAAGTGMVLNADGLVLTNNHVIEDSTKITATVVATGKTYTATVVGYDVTGDVALVQLQDASGLTTVPVGNSSAVKVGGTVVALGNAEGQGSISATAGQVTGLNQTITASDEGGSTGAIPDDLQGALLGHSLATYGWVWLIAGVILIAAGILVLGPSDKPSAEVSRWIGIIAAGLNAIAAIFVIPYYPVWSLIDIALAVMVIYGLSAHFSDREASPSRPE